MEFLHTGTQFSEADRTVTYIVENATGTVTVTGGVNVAWVSGNKFINSGSGFNAAQWPSGTVITINGVGANVNAVATDIAVTLRVAIANGVGVSYSVASGRWVYPEWRICGGGSRQSAGGFGRE